MLYLTNVVEEQLKINNKLLDDTISNINIERKKNYEKNSSICKIAFIIMLVIILVSFCFGVEKGIGVVILSIILGIFILISLLNKAPVLTRNNINNEAVLNSLSYEKRQEIKNCISILIELSNIKEKIIVSRKTCPKCGTSILADALYVNEKNDNIFMYKCPECKYEFRENMYVGEQSVKIGASI